jgi:subtilisin-like proprotein convertase family protein
LTAAIVAVLLVGMLGTAHAEDVPPRINVQALLLDKAGKAVDGVFDITFSLWTNKTDGFKVWGETQPSILASQGLIDVVLGADVANPVLPDVFSTNAQVWLQVQIAAGPGIEPDGEAPLPRRPFNPVGFAFHSQTAQLAVNASKLDGKTFIDVQTDIMAAVNAEGFIKPGVPVGEASLPANGLNEVSNGLLTNQFTDEVASTTTPIDIKDLNPIGVSNEIIFPDIGTAEEFSVSVNISNSDLSGVTVNLYDPTGTKFVLYDKNGPGKVLGTTYPSPTQPVDGDLSVWVGKNPKGTWTLEVKDMEFNADTNPVDGKINSWSISVSTLSTKKVKVAGDLVIGGKITNAGGVGAPFEFQGDFIINNADGNPIFKIDHKTSTVNIMNNAVFNVLDADGNTVFKADGLKKTFSSGIFAPGSRPYLYGWEIDHTNGNWVMGPQPEYAHQVDVGNNQQIYKYVEQVIYGDKHGNFERGIGGDNYGNDSTDKTHQVMIAFVKNPTANSINKQVWFRWSSSGCCNTNSGLAVNGNNVWSSNSQTTGSDSATITFPPNQTSVVVLKTGNYRWTTWNGSWQKNNIGFYNDSWNLTGTDLQWDYDRYMQWLTNK